MIWEPTHFFLFAGDTDNEGMLKKAQTLLITQHLVSDACQIKDTIRSICSIFQGAGFSHLILVEIFFWL